MLEDLNFKNKSYTKNFKVGSTLKTLNFIYFFLVPTNQRALFLKLYWTSDLRSKIYYPQL